MQWGKYVNPMAVLFEGDAFRLPELDWNLCFIARFRLLEAKLLGRPIFEIFVHPLLPVLVSVGERISGNRRSLHTG